MGFTFPGRDRGLTARGSDNCRDLDKVVNKSERISRTSPGLSHNGALRQLLHSAFPGPCGPCREPCKKLSSRDRTRADRPDEPRSRDRGSDGDCPQRLRLPPRARAARLGGPAREVPAAWPTIWQTALDFPIEEVVGRYEHPAYGPLTVRAEGNRPVMQFRTLRSTLVYQGERRFIGREPLLDGLPPIAVWFSRHRKRASP